MEEHVAEKGLELERDFVARGTDLTAFIGLHALLALFAQVKCKNDPELNIFTVRNPYTNSLMLKLQIVLLFLFYCQVVFTTIKPFCGHYYIKYFQYKYNRSSIDSRLKGWSSPISIKGQGDSSR